MDTAKEDKYYRDDSLCVKGADFIVLSAEGHYSDRSGNNKAWLFKVKQSSLMRYSNTFRDMLEVGSAEASKDDLIDGLPFIRLDEAPEALDDFLDFFKEDPDVWVKWRWIEGHERLLACWTIALKYDTPHVTYICEEQFVSAVDWDVDSINAEPLLKAYSTAVAWNRTQVARSLLTACGQLDLGAVEMHTMLMLPSTDLNEMWKARAKYLQEKTKIYRKQVKYQFEKISSEYKKGSLVCTTTQAQKVFEAAVRAATE